VDAATRGDKAALDQIDEVVFQMRDYLDSRELHEFDNFITVGSR
jgi:hypothetical protein